MVRNSFTIPGNNHSASTRHLHLIAWCSKPRGFHRELKLSSQVHLDKADLHIWGSTNATHEFNIHRKVYFTDYFIHQTCTCRVYPQWMRSSQVWMRSNQVWMRSSQVVSWLSMPKSQHSWVRSQHLPTQWNLRAADEAVLNNVHEKKKSNYSPFMYVHFLI